MDVSIEYVGEGRCQALAHTDEGVEFIDAFVPVAFALDVGRIEIHAGDADKLVNEAKAAGLVVEVEH